MPTVVSVRNLGGTLTTVLRGHRPVAAVRPGAPTATLRRPAGPVAIPGDVAIPVEVAPAVVAPARIGPPAIGRAGRATARAVSGPHGAVRGAPERTVGTTSLLPTI